MFAFEPSNPGDVKTKPEAPQALQALSPKPSLSLSLFLFLFLFLFLYIYII